MISSRSKKVFAQTFIRTRFIAITPGSTGPSLRINRGFLDGSISLAR